MRKEAKELARMLEREHGLQVGYDGRDHYIVRDPKQDYKVVARFASTPSSPRWRENAVQDLMHAGVLAHDPFKAGAPVTTIEKPRTSGLDVAAAMRAQDKRAAHVKANVERVFAELGHKDGLPAGQSSGIPTRFVERAAAYAAEQGNERQLGSLTTALWQLRHNKRVGSYTLDLFERVVWEWDNNINRPSGRTNFSTAAGEKRRKKPTQPVAAAEATCEVCGQKFDTEKGLKVHALTHDTEACRICGETVAVSLMSKHMGGHRAANETPTKQTDRDARIATLRDRARTVVEAGDARALAFAIIEADPKSATLDRNQKYKAVSNALTLFTRFASGGTTRIYTATLDQIEAGLALYEAAKPATATAAPAAKPEAVDAAPAKETGYSRVAKLAEPQEAEPQEKAPQGDSDDAIRAVLTLIAGGQNSPEAINAATLLLKQLT